MIGKFLLPAVWLTLSVQAQTTNVVCKSNFNYLNNKEGQNPCLVSAYLQVPCSSDGKNFDVPALQANQSYIGPSSSDVNYCSCSSVVYSLVSACAQCQGFDWISWSYWRNDCTQQLTTVGQYPLDIPAGTGVPAWAYQNVALIDRWNQSLALPQIATAAESTYYGTPTASISYHVSTAGDAGTQTGAAVSQTSAASSSGSKSNAGAIAGGVVGGIALLALIGVLVWLIVRRRRKQALAPSPTAYYPPGGPQMGQAGEGNYPAAVDYGASYPPTSPTIFSGSSGTPAPMKLYDPSDPSTFPKTPASFGYQSTEVTDTTNPSTFAHEHSTGGGRYTGVAEI